MGSWVSKDGVVVPAKEKVALTDKDGNPFIYEGPDRSATEYLKEQGADHLGRHWSEDPEVISRIRQVYNISVKEYMKMMGYDANTTMEEFNKKLEVVNTHQEPKRNPAKRQRSGGQNTAGNSGHYEGDFGDLADAKSKIK